MSDYTPASERTIYSGMCSDPDCMTTIAVWPHWERQADLPDQEEWEESCMYCPVCDSSVEMDWADPMAPTIRTGYAPHQFEEVTDE